MRVDKVVSVVVLATGHRSRHVAVRSNEPATLSTLDPLIDHAEVVTGDCHYALIAVP